MMMLIVAGMAIDIRDNVIWMVVMLILIALVITPYSVQVVNIKLILPSPSLLRHNLSLMMENKQEISNKSKEYMFKMVKLSTVVLLPMP